MKIVSNFQSVLDRISSTYENNLFVSTLFEFLEYEPQITPPEKPRPMTASPEARGLDIEFRDVSFTYPAKDPETEAAIKNVCFALYAGEASAMFGSNRARNS